MDHDIEIIRKFARGDASSFDEIYRLYYNKVYSFSYRYLQSREEAEEVVQEVFISLWNNREKFHEIRNLNAWLFTVTFNQIRKIFRDMAIKKRKLEIHSVPPVFKDPVTRFDTEFDDLMEKAQGLIEKLPWQQKNVMLLSVKEGLNSTEISQKLKITKRTVENHLSSARTFLKKLLRDEHLLPLFIYWILF